MKTDTRRRLGITLLVMGLLAVGLAVWQLSRPAPSNFRIIDSQPLVSINPQVGAVAGDAPRVDVPDTPPLGRTVHVLAGAPASGDGSWKRPWRDLQAAFCRLEPGDRLLVMAGNYQENYHIGPACQDGTVERPIEVYFSDDAVLMPDFSDAPVDDAVITVSRSHWRLAGIEIRPFRTLTGIRVGPAVSNVIIESAHIYSGLGRGISIDSGSTDILVTGSHLHQLGSLEGRGDRWEMGVGAGVTIAAGTRGVAIRDTRIHNVLGEPVLVLEPAEGSDLEPATDLDIDDKHFQVHQDRWW